LKEKGFDVEMCEECCQEKGMVNDTEWKKGELIGGFEV